MKFIHYLYIAPLAFLAACSNEELPTAEEQHPDGAIELSAGIVEGGSQQVVTRAGAEDNHARHLNLATNTKLALQVSGTWTGHSPNPVVQTTTGTIGSTTGTDNLHNVVTCNPVLYWDDYGSAAEGNYDPNNKTATSNGAGTIDYGRGIGLTIYGAAVNGKDTIPTISSAQWTSGLLPWGVAANQTTANWQPADKDLLISNNVKAGTDDGTYKFDERDSGKLLEFTHALSKITINLKAGAGFADSDNDGIHEFTNIPTVTLTSNEANTSTYTNWPYTTGTVNITTGTVTNQGNNAVITMNAAATDATLAALGYTVTKEALVMPGSLFKGKVSNEEDAPYHIIARIDADGNIYYVTSEKIRTAINATAHTEDDPTLAGKNYIINVIVNKTDIVVTATVKNWTDVTADDVEPVINISDAYGSTGVAMGDISFSFYRSLSLDNGYSANKTLVDEKYYPEESVVTKSSGTWTMDPTLYWPNHNTHYQFRGVWPRTESVGGPRVEDGSGTTSGYQVIKVQNVAYDDETFPSDLQIARPEFADKTQKCTNNEDGHTSTILWSGGICATEGEINLNFNYMMSQVEVNLSTTDNSLGDAVELSGAVVELVNVYSTGDVKLGDREVITTGTTGNYTLDTTFQGHDKENNNEEINITSHPNRRWSAIVPQPLTYTSAQAAGNVKFRITITNPNGTTDIYYADVKPIPVTEEGSTGPAAPITEWESGKHYIYNLMLSKTQLKVTATLAKWIKVTASENVWF